MRFNLIALIEFLVGGVLAGAVTAISGNEAAFGYVMSLSFLVMDLAYRGWMANQVGPEAFYRPRMGGVIVFIPVWGWGLGVLLYTLIFGPLV